MRLPSNVVALYHNLFNIRFAVISALVNGSIDVWLNLDHGPAEYWYAGGWQALHSFFSTGVTARVIQHCSHIKNPLVSYPVGSIAATALTFAGSFAVHWLNGTPELLASCLWPTGISFCTGFGTNFMTRRGYWLPGNYNKTAASD